MIVPSQCWPCVCGCGLITGNCSRWDATPTPMPEKKANRWDETPVAAAGADETPAAGAAAGGVCGINRP